jgi:NADPH2:quinone reductase
MKAVWYERQGAAQDVLVVGELDVPEPGNGEVRIRVKASGINPGDLKKRQDAFGIGMQYPRVVPHSDGAGLVDKLGVGVAGHQVGDRVWCYGAQSYRPFGTSAEYVVVPQAQAVFLPAAVSFQQGACIGIPGITAHRAVHAAGAVDGKIVLVQGAAGAVGSFAVGLARLAGACVIATVRSDVDAAAARRAGAHEVLRTDGRALLDIVSAIKALAEGRAVDHVVEVAFDENVEIDTEVLGVGGSICAYATMDPNPAIPFWPLLFKNIRAHFVGSDDVPSDAKLSAAQDLNRLWKTGWAGLTIDRTFSLEQAAVAHEYLEKRRSAGRVLLML